MQRPGSPNNNHPEWSPDGSRILFASDRAGSDDLYLMNEDGSGVVQLTGAPERETYPSWSQTGDRIAFVSLAEDRFVISIMNTGGTETEVVVDEGSSFEPRFSPDDRLLVYTSMRDGNADIISSIWSAEPSAA